VNLHIPIAGFFGAVLVSHFLISMFGTSLGGASPLVPPWLLLSASIVRSGDSSETVTWKLLTAVSVEFGHVKMLCEVQS
jgi:hypothetical protein